ncbi:hypothetical protein GOP47_0025541 [Adiantum capillus-veneris]|uniref:cysteine--tRNA ligase n=1 Tax=Adiantum capillus-veneris TaxID=13818 RepID=A0A9D4U0W5_ADICA|nr:hypothetical protein GOP47_0025541 [Adiantum capillus-veneris]
MTTVTSAMPESTSVLMFSSGGFDRFLMHLGFDVKYVRNFTDVDDKIIARASKQGEDPLVLSDRFCKEFHSDMEALQCLPATVEPRVTTHMVSIIKLIEQIVDKGYGYVLENGDVYFSVDKYVEEHGTYGSLSGRDFDENRAGERVAVDERKHNPADFALWKSAKQDEPAWKSPWGLGRPGWHIECSAMSAEHLGSCFDIHGGGMDLIFPHHENEIAQSCAACPQSRVNYWLHNGFVTVDTQKMSKSLGNFFTIREVLERYHPTAIRLFLLGTHYRSPINYSNYQLEKASDRAYYIYQTLEDSAQSISTDANGDSPISTEGKACIERLQGLFKCSMADDLLTPAVIAALSEPLKVMNDLLHTKQGRKDKSRLTYLKALQTEVKQILEVLGLFPNSLPQVLNEMKVKALRRANLTSADVDIQLKERAEARSSKDYAKSDIIRDRLASLGIAVMDTPQGTIWRPCIPTDMS